MVKVPGVAVSLAKPTEAKVQVPGVPVSFANQAAATSWIYSLSLHDALPILSVGVVSSVRWSALEPELSAKPVITGADGSVLSMLIENAADAVLVLAAGSVDEAAEL